MVDLGRAARCHRPALDQRVLRGVAARIGPLDPRPGHPVRSDLASPDDDAGARPVDRHRHSRRDSRHSTDDGYGTINGTINSNRHSGRNGDRQLAIHGDLDARSVIPAAPAG